MRRIRELKGHEKFTPLHAALLVFSLDALGCCFIRAAARESVLPAILGMVLFLFIAWYGVLLLVWQPPGPYPLMVGASLTAVNVAWGGWLLMRDPPGAFRMEYVTWAVVLSGAGVLTSGASLLARRGRPGRAGPTS